MKPAAWLSAGLLACGAAPAAVLPPTPVASSSPVASTAPSAAKPADGPTVVTYAEIPTRWVEEKMTVDPAAAKAWAADAANAKLVLPTTRHVLVKIDPTRKDATEAAARKRAEAALARIRRGEDFGSVAKAVSEDPGSRDNGGAYPGQMVRMFVEPYVAAYTSLAPGEVTKQLVRTTFGFHIIKKDPLDAAAIDTAYRRAQAPQLTRRLAGDLAERWRAPLAERRAMQELDAAIESTFGGKCACAEERPRVVVVPVDKVDPKGSSTCAKLVTTPRGESRIFEYADEVFVAKAGDRADVDPGVGPALDVDPKEARWGVCTPVPEGGGAQITPEQLRKMIEEVQRKQRSGR